MTLKSPSPPLCPMCLGVQAGEVIYSPNERIQWCELDLGGREWVCPRCKSRYQDWCGGITDVPNLNQEKPMSDDALLLNIAGIIVSFKDLSRQETAQTILGLIRAYDAAHNLLPGATEPKGPFLVFGGMGSQPRYEHPTEAGAIEEAKRLANLYGGEFRVLAHVAKVQLEVTRKLVVGE